MKEVSTHHYTAVEDLRVGMFVHLEGGWLAHPFPLSNFKISSPQQIATIRSLRSAARALESWQERPRASPTGEFEPAPPRARSTPAGRLRGVASQARGRNAGTAHLPPAQPPNRRNWPPSATRRLALAAQREALQHCQRQFAEAAGACKTLTDLVASKPQLAREQAEALSRAFVDKMLGQDETCIRLLGEVAGDKASTHAVNVTVISLLLGKTFGLAEADMLDLGVGAMLHDIGKLDAARAPAPPRRPSVGIGERWSTRSTWRTASRTRGGWASPTARDGSSSSTTSMPTAAASRCAWAATA